MRRVLFMVWMVLLLCMASGSALADSTVLKQSEAELRKKQIDDVRYALDLELPENGQAFKGVVRTEFVFHPQMQPLRVDFQQGTVEWIRVNGQEVSFDARDGLILLKEAVFQADSKNLMEIRYSHPYSKNSTGLFWFRDPVDQRAYTYTHLEPYAANSFFPCFDQPDLKASYQLTVKVDKSWTVISAVRESRIVPAGEQNIWEFPASARFSSYLLPLHAGPFKVWEDRNFKIPLRLMARQSLAEHVPVEEWLDTSRRGLAFFETYLGIPYPFGKYDQIVVPDFSPGAGAMENVAAVTYNEDFLVRGKRTRSDEESLARDIYHELAHMWFGNLVTMQWWNDLWLNESFASYAETLALASDPRFPHAWASFNRSSKVRAYYFDQSVTTHPVVQEAADAESGKFDGISYGKGAAFLQQLHYMIGDSTFQKGLQIYFKRHAYGNTQLRDFILAMENSSGRQLQSFTSDWLQTAGVNTLSFEFSCSKGKVEHFNLRQSAPAAHPTLREHKTQLAFYAWRRDHFELITQEAVSYQGALTPWPKARGLRCPDFVFPNLGDYDYVQTVLDPKSQKLAYQHQHLFADPLQRILLWNSMSEMVVSAKISLRDFARYVARQLPQESDFAVLQALDSRISLELFSYVELIPDQAIQKKVLDDMIRAYDERLNSGLSADSKKLLWNTYVDLLTAAGRSDALRKILQGQRTFPAVTLDQDQRWALLLALSKLGSKDVLGWAEVERQKDPSNAGQKYFLGIKAAFPDYEQKMKLLEPLIQVESSVPAAERNAVLNELFPAQQPDLRQRYAPTFQREVDGVINRVGGGRARAYLRNALPTACDGKVLALINELLSKPYPEDFHEILLWARQKNERCQKIMTRLSVRGAPANHKL